MRTDGKQERERVDETAHCCAVGYGNNNKTVNCHNVLEKLDLISSFKSDHYAD
jgi:hypothetical protein